MRLSEYQLEVIRSAVEGSFGEVSALFLFGSRTDDRAKGGDIDLYIETNMRKDESFIAELQLAAELQRRLGEQKIDIVVRAAESSLLPIHQEARRTGIRL